MGWKVETQPSAVSAKEEAAGAPSATSAPSRTEKTLRTSDQQIENVSRAREIPETDLADAADTSAPIYTPYTLPPSLSNPDRVHVKSGMSAPSAMSESTKTHPDRWIPWYHLRALTAFLPGWAKRKHRRIALPVVRRYILHGRDEDFEILRSLYRDWQPLRVSLTRLPPELPREEEESVTDWLDRCYEAGGYVKPTY